MVTAVSLPHQFIVKTHSTTLEKVKTMTLRFITPAVVGALILGTVLGGSGLYFYEQHNKPAPAPVVAEHKVTATYLTADNASTLINAKVSGGTIASAEPSKPVLVVMCAEPACEQSALNLTGVQKDLDGKVTVVALDPYAQKPLASSIEEDLVGPAVVEQIGQSVLVQILQSNNIQPTDENIQKIVSDPRFQQMTERQAASNPLLKPVYPKVFLFSDGDFKMVAGALGVTSEENLVKFSNAALQGLAKMKAAQAEELKAQTDAVKAAAKPDLKALAAPQQTDKAKAPDASADAPKK